MNVNIWEKVLLELGYEFKDELCGRYPSKNNILVYQQKHIVCQIWFIRDTEEITYVNFLIPGETYLNKDIFESENKSLFRKYKLEELC